MTAERREPDRELSVIRRCVDAIESLDTEAAARVLFYLAARYKINFSQSVATETKDNSS